MNIKRTVFSQALAKIDSDQFLIFTGPRQAGKTTILKQLQQQLHQTPNFFINLEDKEYLSLLDQSPKNLFKLIPPASKQQLVFIDEIQYLKDPTNFLKLLYDEYRAKVKLIVSGSSAFYIDRKFKDSLVGRKIIFQVNTLSFDEFLQYKKPEISNIKYGQLTIPQREIFNSLLDEYLIYGGYPRVVIAPHEQKEDILQDVTYSYIKKDVFESHIRSDELFYRLLKILAAQVGNLVNSNELSRTMETSKTLIANYLYIMRKSFHIHLVSPFFKSARKEITKMPKIYFHDLGLRNFLINDFSPFIARIDKGQLLENFVFRLLLEKNPTEDIKFWRTVSGNEVDFVIGNRAIEVKTNKKDIKLSKYRRFKQDYPQIKLDFINHDNIYLI